MVRWFALLEVKVQDFTQLLDSALNLAERFGDRERGRSTILSSIVHVEFNIGQHTAKGTIVYLNVACVRRLGPGAMYNHDDMKTIINTCIRKHHREPKDSRGYQTHQHSAIKNRNLV
jgi:hypothetical protein